MDEDDNWIQQRLKNQDWNSAAYDPSNSDDLDDINYIKENVDPKIEFDFSFDEKQMQILKDNMLSLKKKSQKTQYLNGFVSYATIINLQKV